MSDTTEAKQAVVRSDIQTVVASFYARVRRDARLGPIFETHVGADDADWVPHIGKIEDFWANVMLQERRYQGNPMLVHRAIPELRPEDFTRWLSIFDQTVWEVLPPAKAALFSTLAHRIGRSLAMGLQRAGDPGPPSLTG